MNGMTMMITPQDDLLATNEFLRDGVRFGVTIGRPQPYPAGAGWRCRVRVECGTSRLEQSQVVAPTAHEVLELALELVTNRLAITQAEFFEGATVAPRT
ncbi:hypothetical protein NBRGN_034_00210 [Nocardia brasiliensis NBRC 14402]|uniref:Uncharacterized protein n=2 Tax=Nocardia brasiliensis TaxID=37326 RepID=K0F2Q1_NOCB7|nr:hypothetical protein O3I_019685 [Nocardia brasiliensis ATCC 700358]GAJ80997.1 hypothetical protein NBRGN_034_00210 [Nocardia brasiliensis NBRC 14402]